MTCLLHAPRQSAWEERALSNAFPDYALYAMRVKRFLPLLW